LTLLLEKVTCYCNRTARNMLLPTPFVRLQSMINLLDRTTRNSTLLQWNRIPTS